MPADLRSVNQRLADRILGHPVEHFIAERREAGRSWRLITRDLFEATGGEVDVIDQTLRAWMDDGSTTTSQAQAVGQ